MIRALLLHPSATPATRLAAALDDADPGVSVVTATTVAGAEATLRESSVDAVFERGYSTDDGTGLGLTIVQAIADAHGWDVTVTESDDGGAGFEFSGVDRPVFA